MMDRLELRPVPRSPTPQVSLNAATFNDELVMYKAIAWGLRIPRTGQ